MKRVQKQFLTALVLVVVGVGAGVYTLIEKVKTPETRLRELRESQRLFHFGRIDVVRGELRSTTGTVAFEVDESGVRLTRPVEWPANREAFTSILDHMAGLAMAKVLTRDATEEELARAGLEKPPVTLALELDDGRKPTLHIGTKNKLLDRYPVTDGDKKIIGLIEPTGYWNYVRPVDEFRSKQIFDVRPDAITGVRIEGPDGEPRLQLAKEDGGWKVRGPNGLGEAADDAVVDLFLVRMTKRLDADAYVADDFDPAQAGEYDLAPPSLRVTLSAGDRQYGGAFGFVSETGSTDPTTVVWLDGTRTLIRNTDPTLKADLSKPASAFVDRTVSRFDPQDVQRVVLRVANQPTVVAERTGDGWALMKPEAREAKPWKLDGIVRLLSLLRASRWVTDEATPEELEEWRLEPWSRRITVFGAGEAPLADVVFGKYADDAHLFIKPAARDRVGVIPDQRLKVVPDRWQDLTL